MYSLKATSNGLAFRATVQDFHRACRRIRANDEMKPPQFHETTELIEYLRGCGLKPVIVGSSAVIAHLGIPEEHIGQDFRATKDLDVVVRGRIPEPPEGWRQDYDSPGVISWISPSGGYVDLMVPGELSDGRRIPTPSLAPEGSSLPIADLATVFKMKLTSFREVDMQDLLALGRKFGTPPLSGLSKQQKENLEYLQIMLAQ